MILEQGAPGELEKLFQTIKEIKKEHPENLMARHFDEDYFLSLSQQDQHRLQKIIATGLQNPDSQMGAYARSVSDYAHFAPFFNPLIKDFHQLPVQNQISHISDWDVEQPDADLMDIDPALANISMRVRVARNILEFPMPAVMTKQQRLALEEKALHLFSALFEHPDFGGSYLSLSPNSPHHISHEEYEKRVAAHQMFKDMRGDKYLETARISAHWPFGRGIYISGNEDFLVWVGEEDHLRIMAMRTGLSLNDLFLHLRSGLEILQENIAGGGEIGFALSPALGAITSCPTNLGAGMRASLHLKLPNITNRGTDLLKLKQLAKPLGLAIRGADGEHSGSGAGGLVDVSPMARLGVSEKEIMVRLFEGTKALWKAEVLASA